MNEPVTVGWCPGALRPMETGDGFVLRVKPRCATLALDQAEAIAELALSFGNGALDLTGRANLQIRGARADTLAPLTRGLERLGLLDANPDVEAIRNLLASPFAGLHPPAVLDVGPLAAELEEHLASDRALRALPAKWSIVLDDGGPFPLAGVTADLRFEAAPDGMVAVGLADDPARATCAARDLAGVAIKLCRLALDPAPRRMTALLCERTAAAIFAAAGLSAIAAPAPARGRVRPTDLVAVHRIGGAFHFGVAAAFGSLQASDLRTLAQAARTAGALDLRLTPWRAILVTRLTADGVARVRHALADTALITHAADRRLAVAACSGAPACHRATTPVRSHGTTLAASPLPHATIDGVSLHVSGCSKGCAHAQASPWTLVGREGLYDLVRDGRAGNAPLARALSFQEAADWISRSTDGGRR